MSASRSACRRAASRDSITQGPAMMASGAPPPIWSGPTRTARDVTGTLSLDDLESTQERCFRPLAALIERRPDEAAEQRVAVHRTRLELGVELRGDEPRMIAQLDHLDQRAVGREAGQ